MNAEPITGQAVYQWPHVTVLVCTYNRPRELLTTVAALKENLIYPEDFLHYVIADDHSPDVDYADLLRTKELAGAVLRQTEQNGGWGANVNNGLAAVNTPYVYFTEDDYVLQRRLDLQLGVALMEAETGLGLVRYRGTASEQVMHYAQREADVSALLPGFMQGSDGVEGKLAYLEMVASSPSLWVYSHGPHLKRSAFHAFYGLYDTGYQLGATEEKFAHRVKDGLRTYANAPKLVILPDWIPMYFAHIGTSYQLTEHDHV